MKRLLTGGAVLALVLGSTASMSCGGGSSANPVKGALDSLPAAPINKDTAKQAASTASSAAVAAQDVPQASDFASTGTLPSLLSAAVARSSLPTQQRSAAIDALGRLGPQAVTPGCPTVTDNSTFPTGTTVDVVMDAGAGCSAGTGVTISGSMSLKGTIDAATGAVNVDIKVNNFATTFACTGGSFNMTMSGSGSVVATGLTAASTALTLAEKMNVTVSFGGSCGGQSASGSGFIYVDASLTGAKSGNTWSFDGSRTEGVEISSGGAKIGEYAEWKGTVTVDTKGTLSGLDDTGTVAISGRVGWDTPFVGKGKVDIAFNANYDHAVCFSEPVSGTLQITGGNDKAVMTFDGSAPTICRCAPWTLNGAAGVPNPLCW